MAAAENLQDELSCSICLEYFKEPVSIHCGHNFCQACISQCWEDSEANFSCPQCRDTTQERNFRPSRELARVTEIARRLKLQAARGEGVCESHQELLKLFCEEDQTLICVICRESRAHRSHAVVPIEEAAQEYKEQFQTRLQALKKEGEKLLELKLTAEKRNQAYQGKTDAERQKIVSEFKQLRQFLDQCEQLLLSHLGELEKEITKQQGENIARISAKISHLSELIREMEGKCHQPAIEFLQDTRSILKRSEKGTFEHQAKISCELEERYDDFCRKNDALKKTLWRFQGVLRMEPRMATTVTLDPDTAHPNLVLFADGKSVRWADRRQTLPDNPERFDAVCCVLGREGFTSGWHCWEVKVGNGSYRAIGVAKESVKRKGKILFNPKEGIWALEQTYAYPYEIHVPPKPWMLLDRFTGSIWVSLNYDKGQVAFYSADQKDPIFTFPSASFNGERIRPWFCLKESY